MVVHALFSSPSNVPPSQGGKYAGFGYQRDPIPKSQSQEIFDTTVSSLASVSVKSPGRIRPAVAWLHLIICSDNNSQGWSLLSLGASKIATTAKENVSKYGNIASQKVSELNNNRIY